MTMPWEDKSADPKASRIDIPQTFRALGSVPRARRIDARHRLLALSTHVQMVRDCLLGDNLNADGALLDLDSMAAEIEAVRKLLGGNTSTTSSDPEGESR